ncbi:hypothetical protein ES332_A03G079700v1 [Gossypium tomentosum]|uniref:Uncharacterized protein n=1 Tax=Gossypium tomentosum TaxID=34277 RepID=A0A5D2R4X1_GOSTO|nr:hypothetical protein ES332_A03G079700v1 [Gossypium tomentosum]
MPSMRLLCISKNTWGSTDAELYGEKAMEAVRGNRSWEPRSAATLVYSRNFWPGLYPFTSNSQEEGLLPRHGLISLRLNLFQVIFCLNFGLLELVLGLWVYFSILKIVNELFGLFSLRLYLFIWVYLFAIKWARAKLNRSKTSKEPILLDLVEF